MYVGLVGLYESGLKQGLIPLLFLQKDKTGKDGGDGEWVSPTDSSDSALHCHKIISTVSHTSLQANSNPW